ncbi:MAG TPA: DUF1648 domain-containing protein [Terriglobales bacterium]|nr:DUF1648 domain-containing protein [Terriglobales bacterium]
MNHERFLTCTCLLWLALPLMALRHWQVWHRLPASMAVHFNAANHPNGWMSREASFRFDMLLLACLLALLTAVLYFWHRNAAVNASSWAVLLFAYGFIGVICYIEESVLEFNLYGTIVNPGVIGIAIVILVLGLIVALLTLTRGRPLPSTDLICEEVQSGKNWAAVLLIALLPIALIGAKAPAGLRLPMVLIGIILFATAAMAWDGFHYSFTRHGLEIRTLGFRLKSLPREQIKHYGVSHWGPICGYGIRGMGGRIAYVWTNQGVRVDTKDGYVFLGHAQPDRIVHDLDMMMNAAH